MTASIWRTCPSNGAGFEQPDDPGRKRVYCSRACQQAAYRARQRPAQRPPGLALTVARAAPPSTACSAANRSSRPPPGRRPDGGMLVGLSHRLGVVLRDVVEELHGAASVQGGVGAVVVVVVQPAR
jgi:hypothetical protein